MHVEVDQSGKIEQTNRGTALAFSDGIHYAILIPAKVKQQAIIWLRSTGRRGKRMYLLLFAVALYHLLKHHLDRLKLVTIDIEYEGREHDIKLMLLNLIWRDHLGYPADNITFRGIGKKSQAHKKALAVFRGDIKADRTLTLEEFIEPLGGKKGPGKPFHHGPCCQAVIRPVKDRSDLATRSETILPLN